MSNGLCSTVAAWKSKRASDFDADAGSQSTFSCRLLIIYHVIEYSTDLSCGCADSICPAIDHPPQNPKHTLSTPSYSLGGFITRRFHPTYVGFPGPMSLSMIGLACT